MTEKPVVVTARAGPAGRDHCDPATVELFREHRPDVELTLARGRPPRDRGQDFWSDFVTGAADRWTQVTDALAGWKAQLLEQIEPDVDDPARGPPPPGVQGRDRTAGVGEEDRGTIRHGHRERGAGNGRDMTVHPMLAKPAVPAGPVPGHAGAVDLVRTREPFDPLHRERGLQRRPAIHHGTDRLDRPEAERAGGPRRRPTVNARRQPAHRFRRRQHACLDRHAVQRALNSTRRMRAPSAPRRSSIRS